MPTKDYLTSWVTDALNANGGSATPLDVAKYIWKHHKEDLKQSGDLFYTWQYDYRWAATVLRQQGIIKSGDLSQRGVWELVIDHNA